MHDQTAGHFEQYVVEHRRTLLVLPSPFTLNPLRLDPTHTRWPATRSQRTSAPRGSSLYARGGRLAMSTEEVTTRLRRLKNLSKAKKARAATTAAGPSRYNAPVQRPYHDIIGVPRGLGPRQTMVIDGTNSSNTFAAEDGSLKLVAEGTVPQGFDQQSFTFADRSTAAMVMNPEASAAASVDRAAFEAARGIDEVGPQSSSQPDEVELADPDTRTRVIAGYDGATSTSETQEVAAASAASPGSGPVKRLSVAERVAKAKAAAAASRSRSLASSTPRTRARAWTETEPAVETRITTLLPTSPVRQRPYSP
eukprot:SAG31_NODE_400_length_16240_cov_5.159098_10_plen_308_part_01